MTHEMVYDQFKLMFPQYIKNVIDWFPNGKNSVRVRHYNRQDFIFTFNRSDDWCFETAGHFINRLKGDKRM